MQNAVLIFGNSITSLLAASLLKRKGLEVAVIVEGFEPDDATVIPFTEEVTMRVECVDVLREAGVDGVGTRVKPVVLYAKSLARAVELGAELVFGHLEHVAYERTAARTYALTGAVVSNGFVKRFIKCTVAVDASRHAKLVKKVISEVPSWELPTVDGGVVGTKGVWDKEAAASIPSSTRAVGANLVIAGLAVCEALGAPLPYGDLTYAVLSAKKVEIEVLRVLNFVKGLFGTE